MSCGRIIFQGRQFALKATSETGPSSKKADAKTKKNRTPSGIDNKDAKGPKEP